jgi:cellulase/cellobiase CelA1
MRRLQSILIGILTLCSCLEGREQQFQKKPTEAKSSTSLQAKYSIEDSWSTGYQVKVTLTNQTSKPTTSWQATFNLPPGESLGSTWNGVFSKKIKRSL